MTALSRLSPREKALVALLFLVALPLGLWFLVAQPMQDARARATGTLAAAQSDYQWVLTQDRQFRAAPAAGPARAATAIGLAGLETALISAGLHSQLTTLEETPTGQIRLNLSGAAFADLGRLLEQIDRDLGYDIAQMQITPGPEVARISANLSLAPR